MCQRPAGTHSTLRNLKMRFIISWLFICLSTVAFAEPQAEQETTAQPQAEVATPYVTLKTTMGDIVLALNPTKAPISVANFLQYVEQGFYDGTVFHRVIPDFMIQAGGYFTPSLIKKPVADPIKNEADNGLFNNRGTVAMARTAQVDSATSQFFINVKNNYFLNNGYRDFGYAVFGEVIQGMDVVDALSAVETSRQNGMQNVPLEPVIIERATLSYNKPTATSQPESPSQPQP